MAERPPPGYRRFDKPLPHEFEYDFGLNFLNESRNSTSCTYLRNKNNAFAPDTIEVNPKHASFAVDTGPLICSDSLVQFMSIKTDYMLGNTAQGVDTNKSAGYLLRMFKIFGCWEDSWTPLDQTSGDTISVILKVTSDTTNEDVVATPNGTDLSNESGQPLSTVTATETFAHYGLAVDAKMEGVDLDFDKLFQAKRYYTNGGKLNTLMGNVRTIVLNKNRTHIRTFEKRRVPRACQRGQPHLFFGEHINMPIYTDIDSLSDGVIAPTDATAVTVHKKIFFNEWNPDFMQAQV